MTCRGALCLLTLALLLGTAGIAGPVGDPADPHGFMADEGRCADCHRVEPGGQDWILDPHIFSVSIVGACRPCHPADRLGRSHPVGVNPHRTMGRREVPADLPLQWSDEEGAEVMTCGTCHDPHLPRLSATKLYGLQEPLPNSGGRYLTYYLRLRGVTPREGFTVLCHACHPNL